MGIRETIRGFFGRGQPPDFLQQSAPIKVTTSEINANLPDLTIKGRHLVRENHPLVRQGAPILTCREKVKL